MCANEFDGRNSMKIAVTGARGFVGRYLLQELLANGCDVVALGRDKIGLVELRHARLQYVPTDYNRTSLERQLQGCDALVHLAGRRTLREDPTHSIEPFIEPNVILTQRLAEACKTCGVRKVVMASTIAVYNGSNSVPYSEGEPVLGLNPYGISKITAENQLAHWARSGNGDAVSLRFSALYGYGERISAALMRFIDQASRSESITISGPKDTAIDQLYVRDAVDAIIKAIASHEVSGSFNIGAGEAFTLEQMARAAVSGLESRSKIYIHSSDPVKNAMPFMDISSAKQNLNWQPGWSLESAMTDICKAYRALPDSEKN